MKKTNRFIRFKYHILDNEFAAFEFPTNQTHPVQYIITQMWKCCNKCNKNKECITDKDGFQTFDIETGQLC